MITLTFKNSLAVHPSEKLLKKCGMVETPVSPIVFEDLSWMAYCHFRNYVFRGALYQVPFPFEDIPGVDVSDSILKISKRLGVTKTILGVPIEKFVQDYPSLPTFKEMAKKRLLNHFLCRKVALGVEECMDLLGHHSKTAVLKWLDELVESQDIIPDTSSGSVGEEGKYRTSFPYIPSCPLIIDYHELYYKLSVLTKKSVDPKVLVRLLQNDGIEVGENRVREVLDNMILEGVVGGSQTI